MQENKNIKIGQRQIVFFLFLFLFLCLPSKSFASVLSIRPTTGSFTVGSVFDVSVILDTKGKSINTIQADLSFPPDKLQITSPSTGKSVIETWTAPPKFDNATGKVSLQGGIPNPGINVSDGLVTTLSFRVKSVGEAVIKFLDSSRVLLNDGKGTDDLSQSQNGIFELTLPPPAGPIVVSETHPSQFIWYSNKTLVLRWENEAQAEGYSYMLSSDPTASPDDISEGAKKSVAYGNLSDGIHYFHIKALRDGKWGGITHFSAKVDASPPADFPVYVNPSPRTSSKQPIIQFITTDALSGVDRYEIKIIPLSPEVQEPSEYVGEFFIETGTSYIPNPLTLGNYDILVRAYDKSDNFREVTQHLSVTKAIFEFVGDGGLIVGDFITIPWKYLYGALIVSILGLGYLSFRIRRWRRIIHSKHENKELPKHILQELEELRSYRKKYGMKTVMVLLALFSALSFHNVGAEEKIELSPPIITSISQNISDEEIFYASGVTDFAETGVVIYLQNLKTGETLTEAIKSDKKGDWFYHHPNTLSPGDYILWTQGKLGEELSPPGPQEKMSVKRTAVQFGFSRLSYETLYLLISIFLLLAVLGLIAYIIAHTYHARKKYSAFQGAIREAEESIRRGFAVLKRDIEAELAVVHKAKLTGPLSAEEKEKEEHLLKDLEAVSKRIGKEVWEIEQQGHIS